MIYGVDPTKMPGGQPAAADMFPAMPKDDPSRKELREWLEVVEKIMIGYNWGWILSDSPSWFEMQHREPLSMAAQSLQSAAPGATQGDINSVLKWNVQVEDARRLERARVASVLEFDIVQKNKLANQILASMAVTARTWRDKLMAECKCVGTSSRPGLKHEFDGRLMHARQHPSKAGRPSSGAALRRRGP